MKTIRKSFTQAAGGKIAGPGFSVFWLMVLAIAILDDSDGREKRKRKTAPRAQPRPKGPRF